MTTQHTKKGESSFLYTERTLGIWDWCSHPFVETFHCGSKLKRFWYYEPLWLKLEYNVDKNEIITSYLKQKLEFSGLFEKTSNVFESFCLKVEFLVAIASKKQKQIDDQLGARVDPSSTFCLYVVKFGPNVFRLVNWP